MNKVETIIYDRVSEGDIMNMFHEAFDFLGVKGGDRIPESYLILRECLINVMFYPDRLKNGYDKP